MDRTGGYVDYGFVAEMYDYVAPYARGRCEFLRRDSAREGGPVLEIGCGTGRVLIPVARTGVEIVGLDLSPYMLGLAGSGWLVSRRGARPRDAGAKGYAPVRSGRTFR
jgi:SAM-dependent methyltransferase